MHPFQKAMLEFARNEHVPVVNMIEVMRNQNQSAMYMDPAHPTVAGHQLIAQELYKTIRQLPVYNEACRATNVNVAKSATSASASAGITVH
jgi:lysophospholipase L1-like esterase